MHIFNGWTDFVRWAVVVAIAVMPAVGADAQARPTPAQATQALQDPATIARLQRELQASGLTRDQVRARLRAEGYPESLLDGLTTNGSVDPAFSLNADVFAAVRALGVVDTLLVDSLRASSQTGQRAKTRADSAFLDSVAVFVRNDSQSVALRNFIGSAAFRSIVADSGFQLFGRELFQRKADGNAQVDANLSGPIDDNYRLGLGDRLVVTLTGDFEASYPLQINREGFVVIPSVSEPVYLANLTKGDATRLLTSVLGRVYSGIRRDGSGPTHMLLSVASLGTKEIVVTGDVANAGAVRVSNAATAFHALYQAGGPTDAGSMRLIELKRGSRTVGVLDVYDYLLSGQTQSDLQLESGDVVFVPHRGGTVRVAGAVNRPATYELKPGETVADVIRMAGGFRPTADLRRLQIERILPPGKRAEAGRDRAVFDIASPALIAGSGTSDSLEAGDILRVPEIANRVANRVTVNGNVWSPGAVAFRPGMRLSEALRRTGGPKPDTYLDQVTVSRLKGDSTRTTLRTALKDTLGAPVDDIELQEFDEIRVFSATEFRPARFVTIGGAVRRPGDVPYQENMTLRDLVLEAGGLVEGALLSEAEIARLPAIPEKGIAAQTFRVRLDSTYLFDQGAAGQYLATRPGPTAAGRAPEVELRPYDHISILMQPDWHLSEVVSVQGQVKYPGSYVIRTKNDRIVDMIARAGGLADEAYPNGIVFIRQRGGTGRIGVDLPRALRDPTYIDNLLLVGGDSIFIPRFSGIVTVRGAVNSPVGVAYVRDKDLDYYVRAAGGPTTKANTAAAYVTQPNGKVESRDRHALLWKSVPVPQPGSSIFVPERDTTEHRELAQLASTWVSILGSLVAIAAIVKR
jgi:protein involved in polysaccharide export with SLBB domain